VRRHGKLGAGDIQQHIDTIRTIAQQKHLSEPRMDRLETRPDGTTAAERFFGQKPRCMFTAILASVAIPPVPLSPPQHAVGEAKEHKGGRCRDQGLARLK
jgi:hypothetical protein